MLDFFKTMFQGFMYVILSPIILILVAINYVYSLFVFFFMFVKRAILFFKGEDMKVVMKYDTAADIVSKNQLEEKEKQSEPLPQQVQINNTTTVKENNTTVIQPIIIERVVDQNGQVKDTRYITPPTNTPTSGIVYRDVIEKPSEENSSPLISNSQENNKEEL